MRAANNSDSTTVNLRHHRSHSRHNHRQSSDVSSYSSHSIRPHSSGHSYGRSYDRSYEHSSSSQQHQTDVYSVDSSERASEVHSDSVSAESAESADSSMSPTGLSEGTISYIYNSRYNYYHSDPVALLRQYESVEQSALNWSSQRKQHDKAIQLLQQSLSSFTPQTLNEWTRFLSMKHSLGSIYVAKNQHIKAVRTFASVILEALGRSSIDLSSVSMSIEFLGVGAQRDICPPDHGIPGLVSAIMQVCESFGGQSCLVDPEQAAQTKKLLFKDYMGELPLVYQLYQKHLHDRRKGSIQVESPPVMDLVVANALLNLAKLLQDGVNSGSPKHIIYLNGCAPTTVKILALYILSFSLNKSPSTVNNMGILLASLLTDSGSSRPGIGSKTSEPATSSTSGTTTKIDNSQIKQLALQYYHQGLLLDPKHPHLYTNLGSLLRQEGHITEAIDAYHQAIKADPHFSIALANLASCLKDQGNIEQAAVYYHRAVEENVNFSEAVSGLANCFGTICHWTGRGGYGWEIVSVDRDDRLVRHKIDGWVTKVVQFAEDQLKDAQNWGAGVVEFVPAYENGNLFKEVTLPGVDWQAISGSMDEGAKVVEVIERDMREKQRQWYMDRLNDTASNYNKYVRPKVPAMLAAPLATTILPFHAFTLPFNAQQVRLISEKCSTRISVSSLTQPWVPNYVYPPPDPPTNGILNVGYVSSDFTNHPLAHLMQSVFGFHDSNKVRSFCYSTSASDDSDYRKKIERESYKFRDVHDLTTEALVNQILADGIHVLVNLNGFTKGARNEVFAVRPCPVQLCLMGFAGPIGAGWCDYILGDKLATPLATTEHGSEVQVYAKERIIYMPDTLFCCDHRQSGPFSLENRHSWDEEQKLRLQLRQKMFPNLPENAFLMANFNQLYKIDPSIFAVWLKILCCLPNAYLWLLQFPKSGQYNLQRFALKWSNRQDVVDRIIFTPVAAKDVHIIRSRVPDLCFDTPECNGHTTAVDVMWSATPILTYPRHEFKLCSRIAASVVNAGFPKTEQGRGMVQRLIVHSDGEYGDRAIEFGSPSGRQELVEMRKVLFEHRFDSDLFNTKKYVANLERAYHAAWNQWLEGRHENIVL